MKVDEIVREKLINNLKTKLSEFNKEINTIIGNINCADSVENLMQAKQDILKGWVESLPMHDTTCYFCLVAESCSCCKYVETHKLCVAFNSTWTIIKDKQYNLLRAIENYYLGESYDNKKLSKRKTYYCHACGSKFRRIVNTSNKDCGNCYEFLYEYK